MALYWPTPGLKGRTFKLCVLTRWDFNFCARSSPLRETKQGIFKIPHTLSTCCARAGWDVHWLVRTSADLEEQRRFFIVPRHGGWTHTSCFHRAAVQQAYVITDVSNIKAQAYTSPTQWNPLKYRAGTINISPFSHCFVSKELKMQGTCSAGKIRGKCILQGCWDSSVLSKMPSLFKGVLLLL